MAHADGPSIQAAEMNAAKYALQDNSHLFPHLQHQKRIMERSFMNQGIVMKKLVWEEEVRNKRRQMGLDEIHQECSKRNDEKIRKALEKKERKKKECMEEEGIKTEKDLVDAVNKSNQVGKVEPEPEKTIKSEDSVDMKQSLAGRTEPDESISVEKMSNSGPKIVRKNPGSYDHGNRHHNERKRQNYPQPNQNQYAFKNHNQDADVKDKSRHENINKHNQPSSDPRSIQQRSNGTSHFAQRNVQSRNNYSEYPHRSNSFDASNSLGCTQARSRPGCKGVNRSNVIANDTRNKIPILNSGKETGKNPVNDGNKEEGELTDDDSESNLNKGKVSSFEDYAEPISSPE